MSKFEPGKSGNPDTQFKPGQSGNKNGRPKGLKNWSTLVQELLDDPELAESIIAKKPAWWNTLPGKNGGKAIIVSMMIGAIGGDVRAATWLRKTGYGDKLILEGDEDNVRPVMIIPFERGKPMHLVPVPEPKRKRVPAKVSKPKAKAKTKPPVKKAK